MNFQRLEPTAPIPYHLLLDADPSKDLVDAYLPKSDVFVAVKDENTVGVIVLLPVTSETVEIKNIAVLPELQGQGIGRYLITHAVALATENKYRKIIIGTANSSIGQLALYQTCGFQLTEVKWNFFIDNYPEPIFENNIQARHMLMLSKTL